MKTSGENMDNDAQNQVQLKQDILQGTSEMLVEFSEIVENFSKNVESIRDDPKMDYNAKKGVNENFLTPLLSFYHFLQNLVTKSVLYSLYVLILLPIDNATFYLRSVIFAAIGWGYILFSLSVIAVVLSTLSTQKSIMEYCDELELVHFKREMYGICSWKSFVILTEQFVRYALTVGYYFLLYVGNVFPMKEMGFALVDSIRVCKFILSDALFENVSGILNNILSILSHLSRMLMNKGLGWFV